MHAAVEARNKKWKASMWSDFLKHLIPFLLAKRGDQDDVVAAAVGLIVYGVTTGGRAWPGSRLTTRSSSGSWPPTSTVSRRPLLGRVREQGHVLLRQQRAATGRRSRSVLPAALSQHLRRAAWDGRGAMMQRRARASTTYVSRTRPSRALHGVRRPPLARKYESIKSRGCTCRSKSATSLWLLPSLI